MNRLIPEHLRDFGTGYNPEVKGTPVFCSAPDILVQCPHLMNAAMMPADFDTIYQIAFGEIWRQFQKRGTCVGQMMKNLLDSLNARLAVFYPHLRKHVTSSSNPNNLARFCVAAQYGAARVEVSNQRGNWDGCAVSWIAEAVQTYGALFRMDLALPEHHDRNYSQARSLEPDEALAVQWAGDRNGVPSDLEAKMATVRDHFEFKCPPVTSLESLAYCMVNMIGVGQGSTLIPNGKVNRRGMSDVEESGGHSTLFAGIRDHQDRPSLSDNPKTWEFKYLNSWGFDWADNGTCWVSADEALAMIRQNDCYAGIA